MESEAAIFNRLDAHPQKGLDARRTTEVESEGESRLLDTVLGMLLSAKLFDAASGRSSSLNALRQGP